MIIYAQSDDVEDNNGIIAIVICSICLGLIGLQLVGFFFFHIFLVIKGNTTRGLIKKEAKEENEEKNQWCIVDPPLIDYYNEISEEEKIKLDSEL